MIYGCPRTATVISKGYNISCKMDPKQFKVVIKRFPLFEELSRKHVYKYADKDKHFFFTYLQKLSIFKEESKNVGLLHDLMYKFNKFRFEDGDCVLKEGEVIDSILLIGSGQLKMETSIENIH